MKIRLDDAVDYVAARMTNVDEDAALAARIANALPDRRVGLSWILAGWAPRLAVIALAAVAITVVLRTFDEGSTDVLRTESSPVVSPTIVEPPLIVRSTIVERPSNPRRTTVVRRATVEADRPDFDRSLASIPAPEGLAMSSLSPGDLPAEEALSIAPLSIADLPLTSESFSPR